VIERLEAAAETTARALEEASAIGMRCIGRCGGQSRYSEQCAPSGRYAPNRARPTSVSGLERAQLRPMTICGTTVRAKHGETIQLRVQARYAGEPYPPAAVDSEPLSDEPQDEDTTPFGDDETSS